MTLGSGINLSDCDTYVFIDVSNIRAACVKTLGFEINFDKLLDYFHGKFPKLKEVRYYEGVADGDKPKLEAHEKLAAKGYVIRTLRRKSYVSPAIYRKVTCNKCGNIQRVKIMPKTVKMKSNVDVYLATELLNIVYNAKRKTHVVLVSCDGDYADMIESALTVNSKIFVSVLATPKIKDPLRNTVSIRLRRLSRILPRYRLLNINTIRKYIE